MAVGMYLLPKALELPPVAQKQKFTELKMKIDSVNERDPGFLRAVQEKLKNAIKVVYWQDSGHEEVLQYIIDRDVMDRPFINLIDIAKNILGFGMPQLPELLTTAIYVNEIFTEIGIYKLEVTKPIPGKNDGKDEKPKKGSEGKMAGEITGEVTKLPLPPKALAVYEVFAKLARKKAPIGVTGSEFIDAILEKGLQTRRTSATFNIFDLKKRGAIRDQDGEYFPCSKVEVVPGEFRAARKPKKASENSDPGKADNSPEKDESGDGRAEESIMLPLSLFNAYKVFAILAGKSNNEVSTSQFMEKATTSLETSSGNAKNLLKELKKNGVISSSGYGVYLLNTDVEVVSKHDVEKSAKKKPGAKAAKKPGKAKGGNGRVKASKAKKGKKVEKGKKVSNESVDINESSGINPAAEKALRKKEIVDEWLDAIRAEQEGSNKRLEKIDEEYEAKLAE